MPVEFFLSGWIDVFSDNEIVTYLVLRLIAQAYPSRARGQRGCSSPAASATTRETCTDSSSPTTR